MTAQTTRNIEIKDYSYPLPDERIARYPLAQRDRSKLLLRSCDGQIREDCFCHLPRYIKPGALMVFNNTKVIQARLHFHKSTGALIEIFCLEPYAPHDYQLSFAQCTSVSWICLVGNLKKWKEGALLQSLKVGEKMLTLRAERQGMSGTGHIIEFSWDSPEVSWSEILDSLGQLPIPPYLNRDTEESDLEQYQTVYSKIKGSVAAPTAGLHFTEEILTALDQRGVERAELTLHVGAGTFRPVKSERIADHTMHAEWIAVSRGVVAQLMNHEAQCIAVGTTSVRTLESLYYVGVLLHQAQTQGSELRAEELLVPQWLPYDYSQQSQKLTPQQALQQILNHLDQHQLESLHFATQIIIAPGYEFKIVRTIITNFHQPQSTLLLLVSAFVGGAWRPLYDYALAHDFRFLSYGDSSLLNFDAL